MIVEFSRHARRRAKLYRIPEAAARKKLDGTDLREGEHELIEDIYGFEFSIKIVVAVEEDVATVITNYPLKKGRRK